MPPEGAKICSGHLQIPTGHRVDACESSGAVMTFETAQKER